MAFQMFSSSQVAHDIHMYLCFPTNSSMLLARLLIALNRNIVSRNFNVIVKLCVSLVFSTIHTYRSIRDDLKTAN